MKTELLVVKTESGYIRFTDSGHQICDMNKASVFPVAQIKEVKTKLSQLHESGVEEGEIFLLTITEEKYQGVTV